MSSLSVTALWEGGRGPRNGVVENCVVLLEEEEPGGGVGESWMSRSRDDAGGRGGEEGRVLPSHYVCNDKCCC